jgi:CHASE2 domain-containing sensor protein
MAYCDVNHWKRPDFNMLPTEDLITIAFMFAGASLAGWMVWLEKHPPNTLKPRLLPTTLIMLIGCLIALLALFHLVDLFKPLLGS